MTDTAEFHSPQRMAALVAPVIDRIRFGIGKRVNPLGDEVMGAMGLKDQAARSLVFLRHLLPDRAIAEADIFATFRYRSREEVEAGLREAVASGALEERPGAEYGPSDVGAKVLRELHERSGALIDEMWSGQDARLAALSGPITTVFEAAKTTGGVAFRLMTPYEPEGASAAFILAERITALRWYRFDAHVAAWESAGLTPEGIRTLAAGPEREAIEEETNRRATPPWEALDPGTRLEVLSGLGALPN